MLLNTTSRSFTPASLNGCKIAAQLTQTIPNTDILYPSASLYPSTAIYPHSQSGTRIQNSSYTPLEATLDGRLWVEPGDMIKIKSYVTDPDGSYTYNSDGSVKTELVTSYVLSRELSGIQALTDKITVKGE